MNSQQQQKQFIDYIAFDHIRKDQNRRTSQAICQTEQLQQQSLSTNDENNKDNEGFLNKRLKRKMNKKNKKKRMQVLNQGIDELKNLIERIYYEEQDFNDLKGELLLAFQKIPQRSIFINKLEQMIKQYAQQTIQHIWRQINKILSVIQQQKQKNSHNNQQNNATQFKFQWDSPHFHHLLIIKIFDQFSLIKNGSIQIEKIIQFYDKYYKIPNKNNQNNSKDLYQRTSNYMISIDDNLKTLLKSSSKHFSQNSDTNPHDTILKLKQIQKIIGYQNDAFIINPGYEKYQNSTEASQERKLKKKSRVRQQIQQIQFSQQLICICHSEQLHFNLLAEKIQNSILNPLIKCNLNEDSINSIVQNFYRKKNYNLDTKT